MSNDSSFDGREANGRFAKGNPGGPGRPRAAERIRELDRLVAEAGPELVEALLASAKAGNLKAMEMLLNRVWPVRRGRPVAIEAPEFRKTADLLPAGVAVTEAVLSGELTPQEGRAAARVLEAHAHVVRTVDLEQRMTALEEYDVECARRDLG
jgi:hypothetical protein